MFNQYEVYLHIKSYKLWGIVFDSGEGNFVTTLFCELEPKPIRIYDHTIYFSNFNESIVRDIHGNIYYKLRKMNQKTFNEKKN